LNNLSNSIYRELRELFIKRFKINFCPIRLGPYSKTPIDKGWTSEDYDPNMINWELHFGNIGIIPGRSNLLIIDCDTQESALLFTEVATRIGLKLPTLEVKTRRGSHYYYCSFSSQLEKKQFNAPNKNIKIDLMAGNKCQVVAPYSMLKVKTENGEKIILDPKAENYELFIYKPSHVPEVLPEITEEQYKKLVEELERQLAKEKATQTLFTPQPQPPQPPQPKTETKTEERKLTDEEIAKIVEIVEPYFTEGRRQNLLLYLAGFLRKDLNISEESVLKLYEAIEPIDDPKDKERRLDAIQRTFAKELDVIAGWKELVKILGEETATELCNKISQALGIQKQKTRKKKKEDDDEELLSQLYHEIQNEKETATSPHEKGLVYVEINRKSKKYARCNYYDLVIEYGAIEQDEYTGKYRYIVHHKVFDCCIDKIYAVENSLTNEKKYEVHFISKNPEEPHKKLEGNIQEIWEEMKKTLYIFNSSVAQNVLTAVIAHYLKQGWYEKKKGRSPPGVLFHRR